LNPEILKKLRNICSTQSINILASVSSPTYSTSLWGLNSTYLNVFGGRIDFERPMQTTIRELEEETAIKADISPLNEKEFLEIPSQFKHRKPGSLIS